MTEPGGMDELRARLRRAEEDAAAARILAGGADRDVGEIRTELREFRTQNTRMLNAMRADLSDLRTEVGTLRTEMRTEMRTVHSKIDGVAAGLQVITDLLTRREGDDRPEL